MSNLTKSQVEVCYFGSLMLSGEESVTDLTLAQICMGKDLDLRSSIERILFLTCSTYSQRAWVS